MNQLHFSGPKLIYFESIKLGFFIINLKNGSLSTNLSLYCINQSEYHIAINSFFRRNILFSNTKDIKPYKHKTPAEDNS
jgi:hypothetical protein